MYTEAGRLANRVQLRSVNLLWRLHARYGEKPDGGSGMKSLGKTGQTARDFIHEYAGAYSNTPFLSFCCRYPGVLRADVARRIQVGAAKDSGDDSHRGQMGSQRWTDHADLRPERREFSQHFSFSCSLRAIHDILFSSLRYIYIYLPSQNFQSTFDLNFTATFTKKRKTKYLTAAANRDLLEIYLLL